MQNKAGEEKVRELAEREIFGQFIYFVGGVDDHVLCAFENVHCQLMMFFFFYLLILLFPQMATFFLFLFLTFPYLIITFNFE